VATSGQGRPETFSLLRSGMPEDLALANTCGAAGMLEAERQFRRIIGDRKLATLTLAIELDLAVSVTTEEVAAQSSTTSGTSSDVLVGGAGNAMRNWTTSDGRVLDDATPDRTSDQRVGSSGCRGVANAGPGIPRRSEPPGGLNHEGSARRAFLPSGDFFFAR